MVATITPKGLLELCNRGEAIALIDVRTPAAPVQSTSSAAPAAAARPPASG
jgi:hypothetical protein